MHRSRREAEGAPGADDLRVHRLPGIAHLELHAARVDEDRLVLLPVELKAEGLSGPDEEDLAAVALGRCPDELVPPRLLDPPYVYGEAVEVEEIRGELAHPRGPIASACQVSRSASGWARKCSSTTRRSFGVFTVSQRPSWRNAARRPSRASSGNVVRSWS